MSETECKWHQEQIGLWMRDDELVVRHLKTMHGIPDWRIMAPRFADLPFSSPNAAMDYADRFIPDRRTVDAPAEWTPPPGTMVGAGDYGRRFYVGVDVAKRNADHTVTFSAQPDDNSRGNILIGLTGPAGSGKDTVADELERLDFDRYALASPLKTGLRAMFDLTREHTDGRLKEISIPELGGLTPRRLMQTLGTEWARNTVHDDVWLWLARQQWEGAGYPGLVITDVRFDNEADFIRAHGGTVWHVQRPEEHRPVFSESHASEAGVTDRKGDVIVDNSGTLDDLKRAVEEAVKQTRGRGDQA